MDDHCRIERIILIEASYKLKYFFVVLLWQQQCEMLIQIFFFLHSIWLLCTRSTIIIIIIGANDGRWDTGKPYYNTQWFRCISKWASVFHPQQTQRIYTALCWYGQKITIIRLCAGGAEASPVAVAFIRIGSNRGIFRMRQRVSPLITINECCQWGHEWERESLNSNCV